MELVMIGSLIIVDSKTIPKAIESHLQAQEEEK